MTLGEYRLTQQVGSPARKFLDRKIEESPRGVDEPVFMCHAPDHGFLRLPEHRQATRWRRVQ